MSFCRRGDCYCVDRFIPQDFGIGAREPAIRILLPELRYFLRIIVPDRSERAEFVEVSDQVLAPVARSDTRDRPHGNTFPGSNRLEKSDLIGILGYIPYN